LIEDDVRLDDGDERWEMRDRWSLI